ncbi:MAG: hypothetical protein SOW45_07700 [Prevotella sp.]|nr:hypothetical protein [Prevotella sp.]
MSKRIIKQVNSDASIFFARGRSREKYLGDIFEEYVVAHSLEIIPSNERQSKCLYHKYGPLILKRWSSDKCIFNEEERHQAIDDYGPDLLFQINPATLQEGEDRGKLIAVECKYTTGEEIGIHQRKLDIYQQINDANHVSDFYFVLGYNGVHQDATGRDKITEALKLGHFKEYLNYIFVVNAKVLYQRFDPPFCDIVHNSIDGYAVLYLSNLAEYSEVKRSSLRDHLKIEYDDLYLIKGYILE